MLASRTGNRAPAGRWLPGGHGVIPVNRIGNGDPDELGRNWDRWPDLEQASAAVLVGGLGCLGQPGSAGRVHETGLGLPGCDRDGQVAGDEHPGQNPRKTGAASRAESPDGGLSARPAVLEQGHRP